MRSPEFGFDRFLSQKINKLFFIEISFSGNDSFIPIFVITNAAEVNRIRDTTKIIAMMAVTSSPE